MRCTPDLLLGSNSALPWKIPIRPGLGYLEHEHCHFQDSRSRLTTQNTTPTLFWGPLPLRHRPISISGASFSTTKTSRHRHRLQQTEECAAAPSPVAPPLFTGRRAASCVSPPRPRPTSPSSSRCGAAAWVHLSQTAGRNRCIIGMGEGENCSLHTERGREGGRGSDRCMHLPPHRHSPPYLATPLSPLYRFGRRRVCERASVG